MRSGYQDDLEQQDLAMWRGRVASAIRGKRGQKLLTDLIAALDAMPDKRLIANDIVREGDVCALGACGQYRGVPELDKFAPDEHDVLASAFNVAVCLIQEIEWINDEYSPHEETPEQRFVRVRKWAVKNLAKKVGGQ